MHDRLEEFVANSCFRNPDHAGPGESRYVFHLANEHSRTCLYPDWRPHRQIGWPRDLARAGPRLSIHQNGWSRATDPDPGCGGKPAGIATVPKSGSDDQTCKTNQAGGSRGGMLSRPSGSASPTESDWSRGKLYHQAFCSFVLYQRRIELTRGSSFTGVITS